MIVISHSWEFVPKGSSHFYYHTNSVKSLNKNSTTNEILCIKNLNTINNTNNKNQNKNRATTAAAALNLDENRSINESYNLLSKLALDNADYPVSSHHDSASFFL